MERIIQQTAEGFVKNIMAYYAEEGTLGLGKMAEDVLAMAKGSARELLAAFVADADAALVAAKGERAADGITVHERGVPRTLCTPLGDFMYRRTYFRTPDGMAYLLDALLGVEAYERVDAHVSAKLANAAAGLPSAKAHRP